MYAAREGAHCFIFMHWLRSSKALTLRPPAQAVLLLQRPSRMRLHSTRCYLASVCHASRVQEPDPAFRHPARWSDSSLPGLFEPLVIILCASSSYSSARWPRKVVFWLPLVRRAERFQEMGSRTSLITSDDLLYIQELAPTCLRSAVSPDACLKARQAE